MILRIAVRRAVLVAVLALPAMGAARESGSPSQSRPLQVAQACRTLCVAEFNACQRSCDTATTRIDCQARCQTRLNLCTSACP